MTVQKYRTACTSAVTPELSICVFGVNWEKHDERVYQKAMKLFQRMYPEMLESFRGAVVMDSLAQAYAAADIDPTEVSLDATIWGKELRAGIVRFGRVAPLGGEERCLLCGGNIFFAVTVPTRDQRHEEYIKSDLTVCAGRGCGHVNTGRRPPQIIPGLEVGAFLGIPRTRRWRWFRGALVQTLPWILFAIFWGWVANWAIRFFGGDG